MSGKAHDLVGNLAESPHIRAEVMRGAIFDLRCKQAISGELLDDLRVPFLESHS